MTGHVGFVYTLTRAHLHQVTIIMGLKVFKRIKLNQEDVQMQGEKYQCEYILECLAKKKRIYTWMINCVLPLVQSVFKFPYLLSMINNLYFPY